MKWLSTKTHRPVVDGNYPVYIKDKGLGILTWFEDKWLDYARDTFDSVTHFIIPDALELEDTEKPKSAKDTPCVGGWI